MQFSAQTYRSANATLFVIIRAAMAQLRGTLIEKLPGEP